MSSDLTIIVSEPAPVTLTVAAPEQPALTVVSGFGPAGADGADGADGAAGPPGADGADGGFPLYASLAAANAAHPVLTRPTGLEITLSTGQRYTWDGTEWRQGLGWKTDGHMAFHGTCNLLLDPDGRGYLGGENNFDDPQAVASDWTISVTHPDIEIDAGWMRLPYGTWAITLYLEWYTKGTNGLGADAQPVAGSTSYIRGFTTVGDANFNQYTFMTYPVIGAQPYYTTVSAVLPIDAEDGQYIYLDHVMVNQSATLWLKIYATLDLVRLSA